VDHNGMAVHLTRSDCEESNAMEETEEGMLWNQSVEDGNASSECGDYVGTKSGDSATDW